MKIWKVTYQKPKDFPIQKVMICSAPTWERAVQLHPVTGTIFPEGWNFPWEWADSPLDLDVELIGEGSPWIKTEQVIAWGEGNRLIMWGDE